MRRTYILAFFLSFLPFSSFAVTVGDRIEMGVSPIKHEITVPQGSVVSKSITFYNNADVPYEIYLTAEDCHAESSYGTPSCGKPPNVAGDPIYAATWIEFPEATSFTVPPKSEKLVNFIIRTPSNAIPGGHYGAIFFNNPTVTPGSNSVSMVRRIGTLLLLTVPGEITYNTVYGSIAIGPGGGGVSGGGGGGLQISPAASMNSAPSTPTAWVEYISNLLDPTFSAPVLPPSKNFDVNFNIPVTNSGNVHILPVGRIELYDENDMLLKKIGKESIRTPEGVFLGEKVVDYLPVNDEAGNVLPNTERVYNISWKGFAYESFENGKAAIKFLSPQDFYNSEMSNMGPLLPWEKYRVEAVNKKFRAKVYIEYTGSGEAPIPYETEEYITVSYNSIVRGINYGLIAIVVGGLLLIWIITMIRRRDKKVDSLEEEMEFLEAEVDELERARIMAKNVIAKKKKEKKAASTGTGEVAPIPVKAAKKSSTPRSTSEKVTPKAKTETKPRTKTVSPDKN